MAREHARILCRIWSDEEFKARSPEAQRMYFLVLSQRGLNHAGVVPMTLQRWANCSAGTTAEDVLRALEELAQHNFVVFDSSTEELLIRSFIRNDGVAKQPNVLKAALRQAGEMESAALRAVLARELRRLGIERASQVADEIQPKGSETLPEPPPNPSGTPPIEPIAKGSRESRGKGEGEVSSKGSSSVSGSVGRPASQAKRGTRIPDDFAVTAEMVAWARDRRPEVDGRLETEKFVNYWSAKTGKDATKHDWAATWRNWILGAKPTPNYRGPDAPTGTGSKRVDKALGFLSADDPLRQNFGIAQSELPAAEFRVIEGGRSA